MHATLELVALKHADDKSVLVTTASPSTNHAVLSHKVVSAMQADSMLMQSSVHESHNGCVITHNRADEPTINSTTQHSVADVTPLLKSSIL